MKITRLRSTEVANISVLPSHRKRSALESIEEPNVWWNYKPVVEALPKILLADSPLFGDLPIGNDAVLLAQIERACKSGGAQKEACSAVARSIIDWRNAGRVRGKVVLSEPLRMTVDTLRYCADVVPIVDGKPVIIHLDCRSSMSLTVDGKEFMKSLIHHTARIGDLRLAQVGILRTPQVSKGTRKCVLELLGGEPRYTLDEILRAVTETYAIWEAILRGRHAKDETGETE